MHCSRAELGGVRQVREPGVVAVGVEEHVIRAVS
jgi:hypothetical protein